MKTLTQVELATILAALRCWQRERFSGRGVLVECVESRLATDGGTVDPLNVYEVDRLWGRLKSGKVQPPEAMIDTLEDARRVIEDTTYRLPFTLRPVYGELLTRILVALSELRVFTVPARSRKD